MNLRLPWDPKAAPTPTPVTAPVKPALGRRRLHRYAALADADTSAPWVAVTLQVMGPAADLAAFQDAARGLGVIPWAFDADVLEEDIVLMLLRDPQRSLTLAGCRVLARQFRERAVDRHHQTLARIGTDRRCPFDLQALRPVPAAILRRGADDSAAQTWLRTHWGVNQALRQVSVLPPERLRGRRPPAGQGRCGYVFYTDGAVPEPAIAALRQDWPTLRLTLTCQTGF
ncbi:hypothetical protein [Kozakia baliensis]|uniref:hypothetical protein n=1 Tax=Kozakia baliensis TaxID=153496 RepID=UPI000689531E|nr:hypothetical protein [Kozakia baliensis]